MTEIPKATSSAPFLSSYRHHSVGQQSSRSEADETKILVRGRQILPARRSRGQQDVGQYLVRWLLSNVLSLVVTPYHPFLPSGTHPIRVVCCWRGMTTILKLDVFPVTFTAFDHLWAKLGRLAVSPPSGFSPFPTRPLLFLFSQGIFAEIRILFVKVIRMEG